ncbi:geranylgeranyl reductase family protein [bacterium]|nr:geranylgeranyl reductase family protein [bacterium]
MPGRCSFSRGIGGGCPAMRERDTDVLVIGAGPAGATAARTAAAKSARVILLERKECVGVLVRCGEASSMVDLKPFIEGVDMGEVHPITGFLSHAPDGTSVRLDNEMTRAFQTVVLDRAIFDARLAEQAVAAGAELWTEADAFEPLYNDTRLVGARVRRGREIVDVKAGMTIAADGIESRVGRWAGLKTLLHPRDFSSCYTMVLDNIESDDNLLHFYWGRDVAPGGYGWMFPRSDGGGNLGVGITETGSDRGQARKYLLDLKARWFPDAKTRREAAGALPLAYPLKRIWADNLLLTGDAARLCDPLTGGGIPQALVSGREAGRLAAEALHAENTGETYLSRYAGRLEKEILKPHRTHYRFRNAIGAVSDKMLNGAARRINGISMEERTIPGIAKAMFYFDPRLIPEFIKMGRDLLISSGSIGRS